MFCLPLALLCACPGDDAAPEPVTGCDCIVDETPVYDQAVPPQGPTCGESLCDVVVGSCLGYCDEYEPFILQDAAALQCALVALRDRTPGIVRWSWSEAGGQYDQSGYVLIHADGTAVRRAWGWHDLYYEVGAAAYGRLPSSDRYDECLAEPDDRARFDCLRDRLSMVLQVCDQGWNYSEY